MVPFSIKFHVTGVGLPQQRPGRLIKLIDREVYQLFIIGIVKIVVIDVAIVRCEPSPVEHVNSLA